MLNLNKDTIDMFMAILLKMVYGLNFSKAWKFHFEASLIFWIHNVNELKLIRLLIQA